MAWICSPFSDLNTSGEYALHSALPRRLLASISGVLWGKYNPIFPCASPSSYTSAPPLPFTWLFVFCLFPACSYEYALNGFAARIELPAILQRLKQHPLVAAVNPMTAVKPSLNRSPTFLQLQDSLWKAEGGQTNAGKGVVLGVIDTGIWPENPFFRDVSVLVWQSA